MNTFKFKSVAQALTSAFFALAGTVALAAVPTTWNLSTDCVSPAGSGGNLGPTQACTGDAAGINLSGYSTTGTGATFATATIYTYGPVSGSSGGLGIVASGEGTGEGPHAMDSVSNTDAMMIQFADVVTMTSLQIGWNGSDPNSAANNYKDSDLNVYAWMEVGTTPTGSPLNNLSGSGTTIGTSGLVGAGWQLVGNYADVGTLVNNTQNISTSLTSSYWLVTAGGTDNVGDSFKLGAVSTITPNKTPEPGSLALLGLGLVGIVAARRRKFSD